MFDFFETVGLLSRLGVLNDEMVHSTFFHWIITYWSAGHKYIEEKRKEKSQVLWVDFEYAYARAIDIERAKDPSSSDLSPAPQVITSNLRQELKECNG